jgi:hypothetical protein
MQYIYYIFDGIEGKKCGTRSTKKLEINPQVEIIY